MVADQALDPEYEAARPCDWPLDRAASGPLEVVRRFCNTADLEAGADLLVTASALDVWLIDQGRTSVRADSIELERVVGFRELLRGHTIAHRLWATGHDLGDIARAIGRVALHIAHRNGRLVVEPGAEAGTDRFLAELALTVIEAERLGTWPRLKACRSCSWVFYDGSKNRSGQWCSMSTCGGRSKVRSHRKRQHTT